MDTVIDIIVFLAVGLLAGWIATKLVRGRGYGLVGDLVLGVIGALIGGFIFRGIGLYAGNILGELVSATVGAIVLLVVVRILKSA